MLTRILTCTARITVALVMAAGATAILPGTTPPTDGETAVDQSTVAYRDPNRQRDALLQQHLSRTYASHIDHVTVSNRQVIVTGVATATGSVFLAEFPLHTDLIDLGQAAWRVQIQPDATGRFSTSFDRDRINGSNRIDRLLSRWMLLRDSAGSSAQISAARYADTVHPASALPEAKPRNKKGLGALSPERPLSDLDELGISGVTVNIRLNSLMRTSAGPGRTPFEYAGRTWYAHDRYVAHMDATMLEASKRDIVVSAIILISHAKQSEDKLWGQTVAHPDADPAGVYVMPNVNSEEGVLAYCAALDFLAKRYGTADRQHGRIHHWIMHNEVDAGWEWTNAGEKSAIAYLDLYHKSMRAAHLIARHYDAHARAFISLTHYWAKTPNRRFYTSRELLELLLEFSRAEGDFDWAIAYHPYAQDLGNPRTWEDKDVTFTFDSPHITYKNIEVLDAWVKQPKTFFRGAHRRIVHLSEQGLNSRSYETNALHDQAAGMAYAWNKIKGLDTIELFHYHNWVDHRGEGGLRIGLRKFPDDKDEPLGKKPIWDVYKALGTPDEEQATAFALQVIGITHWSDIRRSVAP